MPGDRSHRSVRSERSLVRALAADLVLLTLLLAAVAAWVGTDVPYSIDEPAAVLQAEQLARGDGWLTPNLLPTVDPGSRHFYVVLSDRGANGIAVYSKHPVYPALLALASRLGGRSA